jgi:hypothetical protein
MQLIESLRMFMTVRASLSSALVGCTQAKTSKQAATSDYFVQIHAFPPDCSPVVLETSEIAKSFLSRVSRCVSLSPSMAACAGLRQARLGPLSN